MLVVKLFSGLLTSECFAVIFLVESSFRSLTSLPLLSSFSRQCLEEMAMPGEFDEVQT